MQQCCKNKHYLCKHNNVALKKVKKMKQSRNTVAKSTILNLITQSRVAMSAAEIQVALDGLCDRVTTYRVLERLIEEDVIHKVVNVDGGVKFAGCHSCAAVHNHNHIHFSCQKCKTVTCLEDVKPSFELPQKYKVTEVNFTVLGFCPQCS